MGSPSKDLVLMEDTLRFVIEQLIDAQESLKQLGEDAKDETLKRHFLAESLKRAQFRGELESILHREGERDLNLKGTAEGAFVRAWTGLKSVLGLGDATLLASAEEGEERVIQAYGDALKKELPQPIRELLGKQASQVVASRRFVQEKRGENR